MSAPVTERPAPVWHGTGEIPTGFGPCVLTLGVFDGLHRGHTILIDRALRLGETHGLPTVLVTFDPHPASVLGLPRDTARLSTVERRAELARERGVEATCVLEFTPQFAQLSPEQFIQRVLVDALCARAVIVGANFTFGHRGAGTSDTLRELGARYGFSTHIVDLLHEADARCSSSAVRAFLRRGDIRAATRVLGRPHHVEGTLRTIETVGSELISAPGTALPAPGRYRGRLVGTGPITLTVTRERRVLIDSVTVPAGRGSVEFTDRENPR